MIVENEFRLRPLKGLTNFFDILAENQCGIIGTLQFSRLSLMKTIYSFTSIRRGNLCQALAVFSVYLALVNCASMSKSERITKLNDTTRAYSLAVRWGEFRAARQFIRFRETPMALRDMGGLKDIRITAYDILEKIVASSTNQAKVLAEISFYHQTSGVVRTFTDNQTWWYDDELEQWFLDGDLPDFEGITGDQ